MYVVHSTVGTGTPDTAKVFCRQQKKLKILSAPSLPPPTQGALRGAGGGDALDEREGARRLMQLPDLGLSDAEEQIQGQPWNYQQRFDPKMFTKSSEWAPNLYALPDGVCDL